MLPGAFPSLTLPLPPLLLCKNESQFFWLFLTFFFTETPQWSLCFHSSSLLHIKSPYHEFHLSRSIWINWSCLCQQSLTCSRKTLICHAQHVLSGSSRTWRRWVCMQLSFFQRWRSLCHCWWSLWYCRHSDVTSFPQSTQFSHVHPALFCLGCCISPWHEHAEHSDFGWQI